MATLASKAERKTTDYLGVCIFVIKSGNYKATHKSCLLLINLSLCSCRYKILFLDVLFPLDLDKVIFVDADQIVRADLKELVDMDLQGAPYGYTPFCDDRPEIEEFRFWKDGYWKEH